MAEGCVVLVREAEERAKNCAGCSKPATLPACSRVEPGPANQKRQSRLPPFLPVLPVRELTGLARSTGHRLLANDDGVKVKVLKVGYHPSRRRRRRRSSH